MAVIHSLRQYPARRHDAPLQWLADHRDDELRTHEYGLTSNPRSIPSNVSYLARALFSRTGDTIVLGAAPFDGRIPLFRRLARRHDVILHTSWPYWDGEFVPHPTRRSRQRQLWYDFVEGIQAVGVTESAASAVAELGATSTVCPHGVDTTVFNPERGERGSERPVVLYVGRLEERKGVDYLLSVADSWSGPPVTFSFVGAGPLADQVREAAKTDRVVYHGFVPSRERLARIYASADVFAIASYRTDDWEELFGIVLIEALASGLPVVSTDCVGPREIIDEAETGYLVAQHDVDALRDRLATLVADRERREAFGRTARRVARERYDIESVATTWASVLEAAREP